MPENIFIKCNLHKSLVFPVVFMVLCSDYDKWSYSILRNIQVLKSEIVTLKIPICRAAPSGPIAAGLVHDFRMPKKPAFRIYPYGLQILDHDSENFKAHLLVCVPSRSDEASQSYRRKTEHRNLEVEMSEKELTRSVASGIAKLDRLNYVQWAIDVRLLLEEKGIWDFAEGKEIEPLPTATASEKAKFVKNKAKSRAIILQSLVSRLQPAAMKCPSAKDVWTHLRKLFEPSSIAREASLVELFYGIRRGNDEELDAFMFGGKSGQSCKPSGDSLSEATRAYIKSITWYKCGATGHFARDCAEPDGEDDQATSSRQSGVCYTCGKQGHISRNCPDASVSRGRSSNCYRVQGRRGGRGKQPEAMSAWMADASGSKVRVEANCAYINRSNEWYLDTCASSHMCGDRSAFSGFQVVEPDPFLTTTGVSCITGYGTVTLMFELNERMNEIQLKNVCYVENLSKNLISIGKIDDAGCEVQISLVMCKRTNQPQELDLHNDRTQGQAVSKPVGPRKVSRVEMIREREKSLRPISQKHKIKCLRSQSEDRGNLARSDSLEECSNELQQLKIENRGEELAISNELLRDLGNSLHWPGVECDQVPSCALDVEGLAGEVCRGVMSDVQNLLAGNDAWGALWAEFAMGLCFTWNRSPYLGRACEIPWILLKERPVPERDLYHPVCLVREKPAFRIYPYGLQILDHDSGNDHRIPRRIFWCVSCLDPTKHRRVIEGKPNIEIWSPRAVFGPGHDLGVYTLDPNWSLVPHCLHNKLEEFEEQRELRQETVKESWKIFLISAENHRDRPKTEEDENLIKVEK
uniref:CCHC-type domain-containing protein n=1 Tax=Strigamia maritima TaxID=126957 RepID=T1ILH3_STRMM